MQGPSGARRRAFSARLATSGLAVALVLSGALASTTEAADSCPNAAVRAQQGSVELPDCRAYELVNPATDDVGEVNRVPNISNDGNIAAYMSVVPGNDALGAGISSTSLARRTADGWVSVSADLASAGSIYSLTGSTVPRVFSSDFSRELVSSTLPASPADVNGSTDGYVVDVGRGTARLMTQDLDSIAGEMFGATSNLDRVLFRYTGSTPTPGLYASDGDQLELLSVYPDGTPLPPSQALEAGAAYQRGLGVGGERDAAPWIERGGDHAVSDDTRRMYFYDNFTGTGFLYLRDHQTTVPVSVSSRTGDVGTIHRAQFVSARHDGSVAYFESAQQLTDAATVGGGIYRFDLATRSVTQITPDAGDPVGLNLAGAIASDDQSHLYFTSTAALAGGAQAGDPNAYVWTSAGGVRFVAKVGAGDKFVRVTPDGRYALMVSTASIAGAPNNGFQAIYRYDDEADQVTCVSCHPDGSPSNGTADIELQSYGFPGGQMTHNRSLTFDGGVVFTTTDRLVSSDQTSAGDVYLYDEGAVSMLTAGRGDTDSYVADVSDDGRNVFVVTRSALVRADRDAAEYDVYDVRAGGGFLEPALPPDPCRADDCQEAANPTPRAPASSSSRVMSAGNPPLAKVAKRLSAAKLTLSQRRTLARTGRVTIAAHVSGGGALSVRGRGRIAGQTKTLGSVSEVILKEAATTVKVAFKLSTAARRELSRRHRLSFTLQVRLSGVFKAVTSSVNLTQVPR